MESKEEILLKDIALVTTLSYFGHPIREIVEDFSTDKYTGEKRPFNFFVFKDTEETKQIISDFENDRCIVNPRRFAIVFRECKSRLYEAKNKLRSK